LQPITRKLDRAAELTTHAKAGRTRTLARAGTIDTRWSRTRTFAGAGNRTLAEAGKHLPELEPGYLLELEPGHS